MQADKKRSILVRNFKQSKIEIDAWRGVASMFEGASASQRAIAD